MKKYFVYVVNEDEDEDEYNYIDEVNTYGYSSVRSVLSSLLLDTYEQSKTILELVEKEKPEKTHGIGTIELNYNVME